MYRKMNTFYSIAMALLLTLIVVGLKIYVNWWGGVFNTPPLISLNKAIFGPKNHETILSHVRGALLVCLGSMKTP